MFPHLHLQSQTRTCERFIHLGILSSWASRSRTTFNLPKSCPVWSRNGAPMLMPYLSRLKGRKKGQGQPVRRRGSDGRPIPCQDEGILCRPASFRLAQARADTSTFYTL